MYQVQDEWEWCMGRKMHTKETRWFSNTQRSHGLESMVRVDSVDARAVSTRSWQRADIVFAYKFPWLVQKRVYTNIGNWVAHHHSMRAHSQDHPSHVLPSQPPAASHLNLDDHGHFHHERWSWNNHAVLCGQMSPWWLCSRSCWVETKSFVEFGQEPEMASFAMARS